MKLSDIVDFTTIRREQLIQMLDALYELAGKPAPTSVFTIPAPSPSIPSAVPVWPNPYIPPPLLPGAGTTGPYIPPDGTIICSSKSEAK